MENYLVYPTTVMNISQSYWDPYSHKKHTTANPPDYPIDECGGEERSWFYCPCNEMEIVHIYGVGNGGTNTIWMTSTAPVIMPCGIDYVSIMVEHPNDDDLSRLREKQTFARGVAMFQEGTDGWATGNHFHISVGRGALSDPSSGWTENGNGAWVIDTVSGALKPQQAFFVNTDITTIEEDCGLDFSTITDANIYNGDTVPNNITGGSVSSDSANGGETDPKYVWYKIINEETSQIYTNVIDINETTNIFLSGIYGSDLEDKKCIGIQLENDNENIYNLDSYVQLINPNNYIDQTLIFKYVYKKINTSIYINNSNGQWKQILDIWIYNPNYHSWVRAIPYVYTPNGWKILMENGFNNN